MTDQELKDLLVKLEPAGLGQLPIEIFGNKADATVCDDLEVVIEEDLAHLFGKKPEVKKEDPIQAAIKKDPLFGSW